MLQFSLVFLALILIGLGFWFFPSDNISIDREKSLSNQKISSSNLSANFDSSVLSKTSQSASVAGSPTQTPNVVVSSQGDKELALASGRFAGTQAHFQVNGQAYSLRPNQLGSYPKVLIAAKQVIPISIHYPDGQAGDPVLVQVEDGGGVGPHGTSLVQHVALDDQSGINFSFQAGDQNGIYRVTMMRGGDIENLEFWVGPELPVRPLATTR